MLRAPGGVLKSTGESIQKFSGALKACGFKLVLGLDFCMEKNCQIGSALRWCLPPQRFGVLRPPKRTISGCGTTPQISNPRNLVKVDPNFLEKKFLDSARQGLSNVISFDPLESFLVRINFAPKFWADFSLKFSKNHIFF